MARISSFSAVPGPGGVPARSGAGRSTSRVGRQPGQRGQHRFPEMRPWSIHLPGKAHRGSSSSVVAWQAPLPPRRTGRGRSRRPAADAPGSQPGVNRATHRRSIVSDAAASTGPGSTDRAAPELAAPAASAEPVIDGERAEPAEILLQSREGKTTGHLPGIQARERSQRRAATRRLCHRTPARPAVPRSFPATVLHGIRRQLSSRIDRLYHDHYLAWVPCAVPSSPWRASGNPDPGSPGPGERQDVPPPPPSWVPGRRVARLPYANNRAADHHPYRRPGPRTKKISQRAKFREGA